MGNFSRITKKTLDGEICIPFNNETYIKRAYERLAELEDKLESRLLVEFPRIKHEKDFKKWQVFFIYQDTIFCTLHDTKEEADKFALELKTGK